MHVDTRVDDVAYNDVEMAFMYVVSHMGAESGMDEVGLAVAAAARGAENGER